MEALDLITNKLQKISIIHVVLVSFSIHMFVISHPNYEVLDELFFTNFMRWFMIGIDHSPYQLPGLSFIVAPFVYIFGDNWISWRFPIVIFGMLFLFFSYKVIEHTSNKQIALLTSIILAFSPVIFTSSSLMLRDIPVMAMGFISIYLYFKQKYYFAALFIGLSAIIKETAIFFVLFIVIYHSIKNRQEIFMNISNNIKKQNITFLKIPAISILIIISSFIVPLMIYENTITVLEYTTRHPEYYTVNENGEFGVMRFDVTRTTTELLEKNISDFNYMDEVKNPIQHLQILLTKGYYSQNETPVNQFIASFLPISGGETIHHLRYGYEKVYLDDEMFEMHEKEYPTLWVQSRINYSYWHVGFWSCIVLVGYSIFQRIRNDEHIEKGIVFIIAGLAFFIPYLLVDMIRDTFAYYMIYFLPIMAFGLVFMLYKIPNKIVRFALLTAFMLAIIGNFLYVFPVWGF
ncbi:MAG: glycosyltransferase family 39 protein [Candidatus Nitrosopumilus sp. bin_68KS]